MGLIKAALNTLSGVLSDQWKEFFYCDALDKNTLMVKGQKRTSRGSSNRGSDNIITSGSGIAVADGQCMLIVEQGKIIEVCSEAGEYTYDKSSEPSVFTGNLGASVLDTFKNLGRRITYGGDTGKDQRVYYINTKELMDNKFGTPNPVPFRVVDEKVGLDLDVSVRCSGVYSYKIADPLLFYVNVCGNVSDKYLRSELDAQLKTEFISALQPGFAGISEMGLRPNQMISHTTELETAMNEALTKKWGELRGLKVVSIAIGSLSLPEEDADMIKQAQRAAALRDPSLAAATIVSAQAEAMKTAAGNTAGAMNGFMGMNMASAAGGVNASDLFAMAAQKNTAKQESVPANGWKCPSCGTIATGKFCPECGTKKPEDGWKCPECGAVNKGKFCTECGAKKPAGEKLYRCDKCGWEPADPSDPPKFCPECGDIFDDGDVR